MTVAGILLTGGSSRRMGRDKATIEVDGASLAVRTGRQLRMACAPAVEVGPGHSGLPVVKEKSPGSGPLAAMADGWMALRAGGHDGPALVVATDLPRLTPGMLSWLADHPSPATVVPVVAGRPQPLCARWSAPDLDRAVILVSRGQRAVMNLLESSTAVLADEAEWSAPAGGPEALTDVDSPADLARLGLPTAAPG